MPIRELGYVLEHPALYPMTLKHFDGTVELTVANMLKINQEANAISYNWGKLTDAARERYREIAAIHEKQQKIKGANND